MPPLFALALCGKGPCPAAGPLLLLSHQQPWNRHGLLALSLAALLAPRPHWNPDHRLCQPAEPCLWRRNGAVKPVPWRGYALSVLTPSPRHGLALPLAPLPERLLPSALAAVVVAPARPRCCLRCLPRHCRLTGPLCNPSSAARNGAPGWPQRPPRMRQPVYEEALIDAVRSGASAQRRLLARRRLFSFNSGTSAPLDCRQ